MPALMVTLSALPGTLDPPQVAVLFQLPLTLAVRVAAHAGDWPRIMATSVRSASLANAWTDFIFIGVAETGLVFGFVGAVAG